MRACIWVLVLMLGGCAQIGDFVGDAILPDDDDATLADDDTTGDDDDDITSDDDDSSVVDDDDVTEDDDDSGDDDVTPDDDDSGDDDTTGDDDVTPDDDDTTPVVIDEDGDGSPVEVDCDDQDGANFPGNVETCDGQDNDCDGFLGNEEVDADGDGYMVCESDCDDGEANTFPGAPELCNNVDDDCDGATPSNEIDDDADGTSTCEGDCDDQDSANFPGNSEICDGQDNDCDGFLGNEEVDNDGDGYMVCESDCDDGDEDMFPGALDNWWTVLTREDCGTEGPHEYLTNSGGGNVTRDVCLESVPVFEESFDDQAVPGNMTFSGNVSTYTPTFAQEGVAGWVTNPNPQEPAQSWTAGPWSMSSIGPGAESSPSVTGMCRHILLTNLLVSQEYLVAVVTHNGMGMEYYTSMFLETTLVGDRFYNNYHSPGSVQLRGVFTATDTEHDLLVCSGGNYWPAAAGDVREDEWVVVPVVTPGNCP